MNVAPTADRVPTADARRASSAAVAVPLALAALFVPTVVIAITRWLDPGRLDDYRDSVWSVLGPVQAVLIASATTLGERLRWRTIGIVAAAAIGLTALHALAAGVEPPFASVANRGRDATLTGDAVAVVACSGAPLLFAAAVLLVSRSRGWRWRSDSTTEPASIEPDAADARASLRIAIAAVAWGGLLLAIVLASDGTTAERLARVFDGVSVRRLLSGLVSPAVCFGAAWICFTAASGPRFETTRAGAALVVYALACGLAVRLLLEAGGGAWLAPAATLDATTLLPGATFVPGGTRVPAAPLDAATLAAVAGNRAALAGLVTLGVSYALRAGGWRVDRATSSPARA